MLAKLEEHTATFKGYVERPGGSHWESKFADAAQANAGGGYKTVAHMRDIMDAADRDIATTIDGSLIGPLNDAKHLIEHALQQGVTVNDDLTMTYTPPKGMSDEDAEHNRQTVAAWAKELKTSGDQAWAAAEKVGQQADATGTKIVGELNSAAGLFNVDKAVADTRPKDAPTPAAPTAENADFYKTQYPTKTTPASTDVAAADPNAPKLGPAVPADKPAVDPKSVGSLGSVTGILDANRKPDAKPADQPAPQSKGFIDGWIDAAKQKGEGLLNHVEDLTGLHGSEKFKDAWIDTGIGVGKDMLRESLGIKDPTPLEQTLDAYSKAQFNREHGLSAAQVAGQEMFDFQSKNAALAAEAASLGPGKLIEKGIVEGAVAADARAALSGAAAPTVDSALTNSIKGFFENASTPHVEAPAVPHVETPSLPHAEVPTAPHVEAPATPHVETPSAPRAEVPVAQHVETLAAPHVETPTPHGETPIVQPHSENLSPVASQPAIPETRPLPQTDAATPLQPGSPAPPAHTPSAPEMPAAPHIETPSTPTHLDAPNQHVTPHAPDHVSTPVDHGTPSGNPVHHEDSPLHSGEQSGPGWERGDDHFDGPQEPSRPWQFDQDPTDPNHVNPDVGRLVTDPAAPFGRDASGNPYSQNQYENQFNKLGPTGQHWANFPDNGGAVPHTRVLYDDVDQYKKQFGSQIDRIGKDQGTYFGLMRDGVPEPWEGRAMHVDSMKDPYNAYAIDHLPVGWKIEVSQIEEGVGQPGGGIQVRFIDSTGKALTQEQLVDEFGVLR